MSTGLQARNVGRLIRRALGWVLALCWGCLLLSVDAAEAVSITPWDYSETSGPEAWSQLDPAFASCAAGQTQSPIDFVLQVDSAQADSSQRDTGSPAPQLRFEYRESPLQIVNNGNTVRFEPEPGSGLWIEDERYELLQFHFHQPSEHRLAGIPWEMEAHFVHRQAETGALAVVAIALQTGAENPTIASLWQQMPLQKTTDPIPGPQLNPAELLPRNRQRFFDYEGSLTTPPCSEGVRWLVLKQPLSVSAAQIEQFSQAVGQPNARPVQPLRSRILRDFD